MIEAALLALAILSALVIVFSALYAIVALIARLIGPFETFILAFIVVWIVLAAVIAG